MANLPTLKEHARTLERQGEIEKALVIYRHILSELDATPAIEQELPLFVKVGDLLLKLGDPDAAIAMYERAAEHFAGQGSATAVIALSGKVLRVAPERVAVYLSPARRLLEEGHVEAARATLERYAEDAGLADTAALIRRLEGRDDDDVRVVLDEVIAGRQPAAESPGLEILGTESLAPTRRVSQEMRPDSEAPSESEPLLIDHTTPPPDAVPPPVERVLFHEPVVPLAPFEFPEPRAEPPPPVPLLPPEPAAPVLPPLEPAAPVPPPREPTARVPAPHKPVALTPRPDRLPLSSSGPRRRVRIRWAPRHGPNLQTVWKWAGTAAAVIAVGAGLTLVGVSLFGGDDGSESGAAAQTPPAGTTPSGAPARPQDVRRLTPVADPAALGALAGALPPLDSSVTVLAAGGDTSGALGPPPQTPADEARIVAVRGLEITRVSEFAVGGRMGYRVVQLLDSGEQLTLTLTPAGPTATQATEPRVTTLAGDTLLGTVHYGGYVVNAQARVLPHVLARFLRRLETRRDS